MNDRLEEMLTEFYDAYCKNNADPKNKLILGILEEMAVRIAAIEQDTMPATIKMNRCSCGNEPEMIYKLDTGEYGVLCKKCGEWEPPMHLSKNSAIKAWNGRGTR